MCTLRRYAALTRNAAYYVLGLLQGRLLYYPLTLCVIYTATAGSAIVSFALELEGPGCLIQGCASSDTPTLELCVFFAVARGT